VYKIKPQKLQVKKSPTHLMRNNSEFPLAFYLTTLPLATLNSVQLCDEQ